MKRFAVILSLATACGSSDGGTATQTPTGPVVDGGVPDDTFAVSVDAVARRDVIQGQAYELTVHIERAAGTDVKLAVEALPKDAAATPVIVAGSANDGKISILTSATTPQGEAPIKVRASIAGRPDALADVTLFVRGPAGSLDTTFNAKGFLDAPYPANGGDGSSVFAFADGSSIFGSPPVKLTPTGAFDSAYGAAGFPVGAGRIFLDVDAQNRAYTCKQTSADACTLQRTLPNGQADTAFTSAQSLAIGFIAYHPIGFFGDKVRVLEIVNSGSTATTDSLNVWQFNTGGDTDMSWGGGVGKCFPFPLPNDTTIAEYMSPSMTVLASGETVVSAGVRQKGSGTAYKPFQMRCAPTGGTVQPVNMATGMGLISADLTPDRSELVMLTTTSENHFTNAAWSKLASNGNRNQTIGTMGYVDSTLAEATQVLVMSDGKVLVGGRSGSPGATDVTIVRFLADGKIDTSFGSQGRVSTRIGDGSNDSQFGHMVIGPDGRIYVAASHFDVPNASFIRYWN